jgi:hypothetical protein
MAFTGPTRRHQAAPSGTVPNNQNSMSLYWSATPCGTDP